VRKPEGKKKIGSLRVRLEDNVKSDLQEIKLRHGQDLSREGVAQLVGLQAVMNFRVPKNAGNSLTS